MKTVVVYRDCRPRWGESHYRTVVAAIEEPPLSRKTIPSQGHQKVPGVAVVREAGAATGASSHQVTRDMHYLNSGDDAAATAAGVATGSAKTNAPFTYMEF